MFAKTKKSSFVRASIRGQQSVCFIFEMFVVPVTSRDPTAFPASGQTRLSDAGFACTRGRAPRPQHEGTTRGEKHFTRGFCAVERVTVGQATLGHVKRRPESKRRRPKLAHSPLVIRTRLGMMRSSCSSAHPPLSVSSQQARGTLRNVPVRS